MFNDRRDAGQQLGRALDKYKGQDALVLAIPKGGIEVAYEVARALDAELEVIIARKLPFPDNPEAGFGAVAEDGSVYLHEELGRWLSQRTIETIQAQQRAEIQRRIALLRQGRSLPTLAGRTVILVDDGIAVGSTMRACIALCRNQQAARVVVAVPVAGPHTVAAFRPLVDDLVVLESPAYFQAVAQVYRRWYDVSDAEALDLLHRWRERKNQPPAPGSRPPL